MNYEDTLEAMQLDGQEFKEKLWFWLEKHPEINAHIAKSRLKGR